MTEILDVKKSWLSVARRLQSVSSRVKNGYSIITIKVLSNNQGDAIAWSTPTETHIEPGASDFEGILGLILGEMSSENSKNGIVS